MNRLAKLAGLARLAPSLSSSLAQSQVCPCVLLRASPVPGQGLEQGF